MSTSWLFNNFAESRLTVAAGISDTTLNIVAADTDRFPEPTGAEEFSAVLVDNDNVEIVHCTSNPLDGTIVCTRAEEGTTGRAFPVGARFVHGITAEPMQDANPFLGQFVLKDMSNADALSIGASLLQTDSVETAKIKDDAVSSAKIQDDAITTDKILNNNVTGAKLTNGSVDGAKLAASSVGTTALQDASVTHEKLATDARMPVGTIVMYGANTPPTQWFACAGQALLRSAFGTLFAVIGETWGVGDGSTTFNIPDFRGYFPRGWDNGRGIDSGRTFASNQADDFKSHEHSVEAVGEGSGGEDGFIYATGNDAISAKNTGSEGGTETRPINAACLFIIKVV